MSRRVPLTGVLGASGFAGKAPAFLAFALAAFGLAGCSVLAPFESSSTSVIAADDVVTGSITPRPTGPLAAAQPSPLSPRLDQEDWRRAQAALATALDPQGNGGAARWENGDNGHKGSFAPVGNAFLIKDDICRTFVSSLALNEPEQWLQGTACRVSPTEWTIKTVSAWKRPG